MKTIRIKGGETIDFDPRAEFYLDKASISIKNADQSTYNGSIYRFKITYLSSSGKKGSFNVELMAPHYFIIARADSSIYDYKGPYKYIKIESMPNNPTLIIQVGFTTAY